MSIEIRLPTVLRTHAAGATTVAVEGSTLGEALNSLVTQYPGFEGQIVTAEGTLHKFVNVYVNDDDVRYLDKLETKLSDGDVISILPAVAGGA